MLTARFWAPRLLNKSSIDSPNNTLRVDEDRSPMTDMSTPADSPFAPFEEVAREPRLSDKVVLRMGETIRARGLAPGTPLPSERELGEQFGVSRTVIREAVRALAAKGIVEVRSGSGLRVAAIGEQTVSESLSWFIRGARLD